VCTDASGDQIHCDARVVIDAGGKPLVTSNVISGMTPAQLLKAYGLTGTTNSAPVIAIVDAYNDPNITSDLAVYSSSMGIPQLPTCIGSALSSNVPCFQKVDQRGGTRYPRSNSGWSLEIALDVEVAHAVCQNCRILLVEADSASYSNLMTAVDRAVTLGAKVVSNSYGSNEFSGETTYDSHFNKPGVAFTVSAGDSGYGAEYPASSRYVTAVGGTSLFLKPDGSYNQELVWGGTGSGCSSYETQPSWQTALGLSGCAKRVVSDVSADADPNTGAAVYDTVQYSGVTGWFQVGGTSLSSPLIAGVYALSGNIPSNTAENSLPYLSNILASLNDVLSGSNGSCGNSYLCTAGAGFDGPTGLGTPKTAAAF
jgi:subtilase family serine protease